MSGAPTKGCGLACRWPMWPGTDSHSCSNFSDGQGLQAAAGSIGRWLGCGGGGGRYGGMIGRALDDGKEAAAA